MSTTPPNGFDLTIDRTSPTSYASDLIVVDVTAVVSASTVATGVTMRRVFLPGGPTSPGFAAACAAPIGTQEVAIAGGVYASSHSCSALRATHSVCGTSVYDN